MIDSKNWVNLSDVFFDYIECPETKFENGHDIGRLKRRNLFIDEFGYIGKETKNIEEEFLLENDPLEIINKGQEIKKILNLNI